MGSEYVKRLSTKLPWFRYTCVRIVGVKLLTISTIIVSTLKSFEENQIASLFSADDS